MYMKIEIETGEGFSPEKQMVIHAVSCYLRELVEACDSVELRTGPVATTPVTVAKGVFIPVQVMIEGHEVPYWPQSKTEEPAN